MGSKKPKRGWLCMNPADFMACGLSARRVASPSLYSVAYLERL